MRTQAILLILCAAGAGLVACSGKPLRQGMSPISSSRLANLRTQGFRLLLDAKHPQSEAAYRQALKLLSGQESSLAYANTCMDLSRVVAESGRPQDAIALSSQAIATYAALPTTSAIAFAWTQALRSLSNYYQATGQTTLSRQALASAARLSKQHLSAEVQAKVQDQIDQPIEPASAQCSPGLAQYEHVLQFLFADRTQQAFVHALHRAQRQEAGGAWQDAIATLRLQARASINGPAEHKSGTAGGAATRATLLRQGILLDEAAHIAWLHRDFKQAAELAEQAKQLQTSRLWTDHPSARRTRTWLACYYNADGQIEKSSALIRSEYERYGVNLPAPTKPELVGCLSDMLQQEDAKRNWSWSLPVSLRLFELAEHPPAMNSLLLSELAVAIGDRAFLCQEKKQEAMKWYQKSLAYLGPEPASHANLYGHILLRIGGTEDALGDQTSARKHLEEALPYLRAERPAEVSLANAYLEKYKSAVSKSP